MTEPEQPVVAVPLRAAAEEVLRARAAYVDAVNGQGHPGEPHDDALYTEGQGFRSPSTDCSRCGGAEYGSEDDLSRSYEALRAALAVEAVRPCEACARGDRSSHGQHVAVEAVRPETDIDEERLARALTVAEWPPSIYPAGYGDRRWQRDFAASLAAAYSATPPKDPE